MSRLCSRQWFAIAFGLSFFSAGAAFALEGDAVLFAGQLDDDNIFLSTPGDALGSNDGFGISVASIGDFDGDGVPDLAVGAYLDDDGGSNNGAVYLVLMNADGSVKDTLAKISENHDPNTVLTLSADRFGRSVEWLGDYDGDGFGELAVGENQSDSPANSGRVWILDLDASGVVQSGFTVGSGSTNFTALDADDRFGNALANVGDWNGDGAPELVVGAFFDDDGSSQNGAIYILYLDPNPASTSILTYSKISDTEGNFDLVFDSGDDWFGSSVTAVGDLNEDGQIDLAVGSRRRGSAPSDGAVYILFMDAGCSAALPATPPVPNPACVVKPAPGDFVEIGEGSGGLQGALSGDEFGSGVAWLEDQSGLVPNRLIVGEQLSDVASTDWGALWILTLDSSGQVTSETRIADNENFESPDPNILLAPRLGFDVASLGDLNADGVADLATGAYLRDWNGKVDVGVAFAIALNPCARTFGVPTVYHAPNDDGVRFCPEVPLASPLDTLHLYFDAGDDVSTNPADVCVAGLGDGDEYCALDVRVALENGATIDSFTLDGGLVGGRSNAPAPGETELRVVWLAPTGTLGPIKLGDLVVNNSTGGGNARVAAGSAAVGAALQLDPISPLAITVPEPGLMPSLLVGAALLACLAGRRRASKRMGLMLATLALLPMDSAKAQTSIDQVVELRELGVLDFPVAVGGDLLAQGFAPLGLIGDARAFVVGTTYEVVSSCTSGLERAWIFFVDEDLTPLGFGGPILSDGTRIFSGAIDTADLDQDGIPELLIGARGCFSTDDGVFWVVKIDEFANEVSRVRIQEGMSGFTGDLDDSDRFGQGVSDIGDVDGDPTTTEIAVSAPGDDDGASGSGAVYILGLDSDGLISWDAKLSRSTSSLLDTALGSGDAFGTAVTNLGDLDGNGVPDLAVGATGDDDGATNAGAIYILFLDSTGPGNVSIASMQKISATQGGFDQTAGFASEPVTAGETLGRALTFQPIPEAGGRGILYAGSSTNGSGSAEVIYPLYLETDGTVLSSYALTETSGHGFDDPGGNYANVGRSLHILGDINGDEVVDLGIGAPLSFGSSGTLLLATRIDSDFDGLDDVLDNCQFIYNPLQEDTDGDGFGDLCDNCIEIANAGQSDLDFDGEGDLCEPVEIQLIATGTPAAPAWNLELQCGAFDVTNVNGAIVLPAGSTAPQTLVLNGASVGVNSVSGPGLTSPQRTDAIYFSADGNGAPDNRLCSTLDPPVVLGSLTTGATVPQLDAAALTTEGVGTPGFGHDLASTALGAVDITEVRLVNSLLLPILDLELGPAVVTSGGTRWDVLLRNAGEEFHRVAFGLIAPVGTSSADMRWVGCDTTIEPDGERACIGGVGFGTTALAANSWTVGPSAAPAGTQLPHTLYVVLEGNRPSSAIELTLNPLFGPDTIVLGTVELDGAPDLEPALTVDGVDDIDDRLSPGTPVEPFEEADFDLPSPTQVTLIGQFNPADDVDGDGVQDLGDNCPFQSNPAQANRGSFLDGTDDTDFLGDACQCAESTNDGAVLDPDDFDEIFDYLAGLPTVSTPEEIEARCSVAGTTECNIRDLIVLKQAIDSGALAVEARCDAALSPPDGM